MSSILTNNGAMVALQTLKGINANMAKTQDQISTGKEVSSAKDNAAIWAVAKSMEGEVGALKSISTSLSVGAQAVGTARQASETVTDLLKEVRSLVVQSQDGNIDAATLQKDIEVYRDQIKSVVNSSEFNGANLIDGSKTSFSVLSSMKGGATPGTPGSIAVTLTDLSSTGVLAALETLDVTTDAALALTDIDTMIGSATAAAQNYGSAGKRIDIQGEFISKLSDSMKAGVGALVDANMEETSARLQALQTQQQLGIQSLSIANQAPQSILSLFR